MIRVTVAGATGWVGKPLVEAIASSPRWPAPAAATARKLGSGRGGFRDDRLGGEGGGAWVIALGNFARSAALLQKFAIESARHFPSWQIIDVAYAEKMDAPSRGLDRIV